MQSNLFTSWDQINWARVSLVIAAVAAVWLGLDQVVPEAYFKPVMLTITAIQSGIAVIMRGSVYSTERRSADPMTDADKAKRGGQWTL